MLSNYVDLVVCYQAFSEIYKICLIIWLLDLTCVFWYLEVERWCYDVISRNTSKFPSNYVRLFHRVLLNVGARKEK